MGSWISFEERQIREIGACRGLRREARRGGVSGERQGGPRKEWRLRDGFGGLLVEVGKVEHLLTKPGGGRIEGGGGAGKDPVAEVDTLILGAGGCLQQGIAVDDVVIKDVLDRRPEDWVGLPSVAVVALVELLNVGQQSVFAFADVIGADVDSVEVGDNLENTDFERYLAGGSQLARLCGWVEGAAASKDFGVKSGEPAFEDDRQEVAVAARGLQ